MNAKLRRAVLARDDHRCVYCGRGLPEVSLEADHVLAEARGGRTVSHNLVAACKPCNGLKSDHPVALPESYTLEPVGFLRRSRGPIPVARPLTSLGPFRWCSDLCPTCGTETLPTLVIDGDALAVQLGYRDTEHEWHTWWSPAAARVHADAIRWEQRTKRAA